MNAGAIVYSILMQGAAVFKRDAADAEQAVNNLGKTSDESAPKVAKTGAELDKTAEKARKSKAPLDGAAKATEDAGKKAGDAAPKVKTLGQEYTQMDEKTQHAARTVGTAMLAIGTAIAIVGGLAVAKFADFEVAVDKTAAASQASVAQQENLSEAALEAGADTVFSAREAANAQTELAKAGLTVRDILKGGLNGSLALAAAGELDVARAAEIAATTLSVFNLKGEDAGHVADLLAAGAGKAQGSVDDLSLALEYVGPTFARLNIPLEETVGTLGLFASQGILGEKAGTGLRAVIQSLTAPTALASKTMEKYSINVFDANGKFIGLGGSAEQLKSKLGGLDEQTRSAALGAIFGAEAANAAGTLYQAGAKGVEEWTEKVNDQGYAAEQAYKMTDNLTGDIERLGGAFDSALITTGSNANEVLRDMVQIITAVVDGYSSLDPTAQAVIFGAGGIAAAIAIAGGAFLLAIPKVAEYRLALQTLDTQLPKTAGAVRGILGVLSGPWGIVILAALGVLGSFAAGQAEAAAKAKAYGDTLDETTGKITTNSREMAKANLAARDSFLWIEGTSAFDNAERLGLSLEDVTDAALGNAAAYDSIREAYEKAQAAQGKNMLAEDAVAWENLLKTIDEERTSLDRGIETQKQMNKAQGEGADATATSAEAYLAANDEASGLFDTLTDLVAKINEANGVGQDAVSSNADYQKSLAEVRDTIKQAQEGAEGYSRSVDETTDAGAQNASMFADLAQKSQDAAEAQFALDGNTETYRQNLQAGRQTLYDQILGLTGSADAAQLLTDKIYAIPSQKEIDILADTQSAQDGIDRFIRLNDGRTLSLKAGVEYSARALGVPVMAEAQGGVVDYFARGGFARERHVAQIARAGSVRVWAEPETGGEAYIPLGQSKRKRSLSIWEETGRRLGVQHFADGGFTDDEAPRKGGNNFYVTEAVSARATAVEVSQIFNSKFI